MKLTNADGKELFDSQIHTLHSHQREQRLASLYIAVFNVILKKSRIENCSVSDLNHEFQTTQSFPTIMLFQHFSVERLIFLCFIF